MIFNPVWRDVNADGTPELLVTSSAGDLACIDADGSTRWAVHTNRGYQFPPTTGRGAAGWEAVAAVDRGGMLRVVRGDGQLVTEQILPETPVQPPILADVHPAGGDEIVVAMPSGLVQVWHMDGMLVWEQQTKIAQPFLAAASHVGGAMPWVVAAGSAVVILDADGAIAVSVDLPSPSSSAPVIRESTGGGAREILVGLENGAIARIQDQGVTALAVAEGEGPVTQVAPAPGGSTVVTDAKGVHLFDDAWKLRWFWPVSGGATCTPIAGLKSPRFLVAEQDLARVVCLSDEGVIQWQDSAPLWGPLSEPAASVEGTRVRAAYGCADGALRVREFHAD
jgi:outer membrane protein assembly factor BamB